MPLHVSSTCAHHQVVKIVLHSLWYHHTYRCHDTSWLFTEINILRCTVSKTSKNWDSFSKREPLVVLSIRNALLHHFHRSIEHTYYTLGGYNKCWWVQGTTKPVNVRASGRGGLKNKIIWLTEGTPKIDVCFINQKKKPPLRNKMPNFKFVMNIKLPYSINAAWPPTTDRH